MKKRWTALITAALLLFSSCAPAGQMRDPDQSTSSSTGDGSQAQTDQSEEDHQKGGLPSEPAPPSWEEGRTLNVALPDSYNGLELPIQGATGFPTVELPLWAAVEDAQAAREAVEAWEKAQEEALLAQEQAAQETEAAGSQSDPASVAAPAQETGGTGAESSTPQEADPAQPEGDGTQTDGTQSPETGPSEDAASMTDPGVTDPNVTGPGMSEPLPDQSGDPGTGDPVLPGGEEPVQEEPEVPTLNDGAITLLPAGVPFTVLQEDGEWWYIAVEADYYQDEEQTVLLHGELNGWVEHRYCMVNLPDVVPSILYDATNSYSSRFVTCGRSIPEITGEAFYPDRTYNPRLNRSEFMMPVLYSMAKKLGQAQRAALSEGNTLILYEGFRPLSLQLKVYNAMSALVKNDPEVKAAVADPPWQITWFIAGGVANHQQGYAVDVGLAKVTSAVEKYTNGYRHVRIITFEQYKMPTPIHELSQAAATFTAPVAIFSSTAWQKAELSASMAASEPARGLQRYCTDAGLTPLASEWWHFNDLEAYFQVQDNLGRGDFTISYIRSVAPG